jgi:A/G-specific adenine glycosylase
METDPSQEHGPLPGGAREQALIDEIVAGGATPAAIDGFRLLVLDNYAVVGRDLPWRHSRDPYAVLVSEVMLQQTQVERVRGRWERFVDRFPDFDTLAGAPLAEVLSEWQGMGYNRRAVSLKRLAEAVVVEHQG